METFEFQELAPELRNEIYEIAILEQQQIGIEVRGGLSKQRRDSYGKLPIPHPLALAQVNKQLRQESLKMIYRLKRFTIRTDPESVLADASLFLSSIGNVASAEIQQLTIACVVHTNVCADEPFEEAMAGLRSAVPLLAPIKLALNFAFTAAHRMAQHDDHYHFKSGRRVFERDEWYMYSPGSKWGEYPRGFLIDGEDLRGSLLEVLSELKEQDAVGWFDGSLNRGDLMASLGSQLALEESAAQRQSV